MPRVLENLIGGGRIEPVLAVLIDANEPGNIGHNWRESEFLTCREKFAQFVAEELVPAIDAPCRTDQSADALVIQGLSFGGFAASYIAALHPDQSYKAGLGGCSEVESSGEHYGQGAAAAVLCLTTLASACTDGSDAPVESISLPAQASRRRHREGRVIMDSAEALGQGCGSISLSRAQV